MRLCEHLPDGGWRQSEAPAICSSYLRSSPLPKPLVSQRGEAHAVAVIMGCMLHHAPRVGLTLGWSCGSVVAASSRCAAGVQQRNAMPDTISRRTAMPDVSCCFSCPVPVVGSAVLEPHLGCANAQHLCVCGCLAIAVAAPRNGSCEGRVVSQRACATSVAGSRRPTQFARRPSESFQW